MTHHSTLFPYLRPELHKLPRLLLETYQPSQHITLRSAALVTETYVYWLWRRDKYSSVTY